MNDSLRISAHQWRGGRMTLKIHSHLATSVGFAQNPITECKRGKGSASRRYCSRRNDSCRNTEFPLFAGNRSSGAIGPYEEPLQKQRQNPLEFIYLLIFHSHLQFHQYCHFCLSLHISFLIDYKQIRIRKCQKHKMIKHDTRSNYLRDLAFLL
jgi:hypothetical protein